MKWAEALGRVANAVMDAINRKRKQDAANDAANTIANGGGVQQSNKSFADLADEPKRNSTE
jgi:hypothetical protein